MRNALLANTDPELRGQLKGILSSERYRVSEARGIPEARDKLSTGLFDLLVADSDGAVDLPDTLLGFVEEWLPGLPVILLGRAAPAGSFRAVHPAPVTIDPLPEEEVRTLVRDVAWARLAAQQAGP